MRKGSTESSTAFRSGRKRILVLAPNWLGDAVMSTPMLSELRRAFPCAETTLGCREYVSPVFNENMDVDRVVSWEGKGGIAAAVSALKRNRPGRGWEACFVLPASLQSAVIAMVSGACDRIGYSSEGRGFLLTHAREARAVREEHLSVSYLRLVETYSGKNLKERPVPALRAPGRCGGSGGDAAPRERYFVLAPGATYGSAKIWPVERYAALARMISGALGWKVAVIGLASEAAAGDYIINAKGVEGKNLAGKLTVREMIGVIGGAGLLVGNDSGPAHISAALGRPTVAIFGSTDPNWTAPAGPKTAVIHSYPECGPCFRRKCPKGAAVCMLATTVGQVFEKVSSLLGREAAPGDE